MCVPVYESLVALKTELHSTKEVSEGRNAAECLHGWMDEASPVEVARRLECCSGKLLVVFKSNS